MSQSAVTTLLKQFEAGEMDREQFITALGEVDYEYGEFHGYDGYVPGTSDALVVMFLNHQITADEMTRIVLRHEERGVGGGVDHG